MIAATAPVQRPVDARLLCVDEFGEARHLWRSALADLLRPGDVVIANDAATIPASLSGTHEPTGAQIEVRLAARDSLSPAAIDRVSAVVFGEGDFHTRTEDRPLPPALRSGDRLLLGPLRASVLALLDHPRLVLLRFDGNADEIWEGLARHGRPVQYAHLPEPLAMWDTWAPIAGPPAAFEPPSAGFTLSWQVVDSFRRRNVGFGTLTHAAGLTSTGDPALDARLPFDEPYAIPPSTARLINRALAQKDRARGDPARGSRIVAIGTSVVRALEDAGARPGSIRPGERLATGKIGPHSLLRVADAILTGTHERGSSHYELLRAFASDETLDRVDLELERSCYRTHEFGDSLFLERSRRDVMVLHPSRELVGDVLRSGVP
jgi:S-adenosylmethionine:tRNA ribosyltransferase-isomerase